MKKLFCIVIFFLSTLAFADVKLSLENQLSYSSIISEHSLIEVKTIDLGYSVGGTADYITKQGFTIGAEALLRASIYGERRTIVAFASKGFGFSIAPEIGYTNINGNVFQILWRPVIYSNLFVDDKEATVMIGNKQVTGEYKTSVTDIKTGLHISYEWKNQKGELIGLYGGMNYNLYHKLEADKEYLNHHGIELFLGLKISSIF